MEGQGGDGRATLADDLKIYRAQIRSAEQDVLGVPHEPLGSQHIFDAGKENDDWVEVVKAKDELLRGKNDEVLSLQKDLERQQRLLQQLNAGLSTFSFFLFLYLSSRHTVQV